MLWWHWFVVAFVFASVIDIVLEIEIVLEVAFVEVVGLEILEFEFRFGWSSKAFCNNTQCVS